MTKQHWLLVLCGFVASCSDGPERPAIDGGAQDAAASYDAAAEPDAAAQDDAGVPGVDCTGAFGPHELVYEDGEEQPSSPSVTDDELLLFFARPSSAFVLAERASTTEAFTFSRVLDEIERDCSAQPGRSIHASGDGLRVYFTCENGLFTATRADLSSAFVPGGQLEAQIDQVALSDDELVAWGSGGAIEHMNGVQTMVATRASLEDAFGTFELVPGLEAVPLLSPLVAEDGLTVYASHMGGNPRLVTAVRPAQDAPFGATTSEGLPSFHITGSPDLTTDCRSIYFGGIDTEDSGIYVARR